MLEDNEKFDSDLDDSDIEEEEDEEKEGAESFPHDTEDEIDSSTPLIEPSAINVEVKCEVGKVTLTLEELLNLKIGSTVEIAKWPNTVKMSANGIYFAEGYLVEINNFLGVKITKRLNNIKEEG